MVIYSEFKILISLRGILDGLACSHPRGNNKYSLIFKNVIITVIANNNLPTINKIPLSRFY